MRRVRLLLPLALLGALLALAPTVSAHAALQSSEPPVDGNAPAGLDLVELRFTEAVERRYTDADVFDLNGTPFKSGPVEFDDAARNVIRLPVQPLPDGIYSVSWQTLSVDTHTLRGQFLFSVGNATLVPTGAVVEHEHGAGEGGHVSNEGLTRGAFFLGLFVALGLPLFDLAFDRRDGRASPALLRAAGALGAAGAVGGVLALSYFVDRTGIPLDVALGTGAGQSLVWRSALLALSAAAAFLAASLAGARRRAATLAAVALAVAATAATSLGSHAAAAESARGLSILSDFLHLVVAGVWIGGVAGFVLVVRDRTPEEAGLIVARVSPVAVASVVLLFATGLYASVKHIQAPAQLWSDPYGRLVALKVLLLLPLVAMGAYNQLRLGPALRAARMSVKRFHRVVEIEALVMVAIVVIAGNLSTTPPPDELDAENGGGPAARGPYFAEATTDTTHVVLYIEPGPTPQVGVQKFNVQLHALTPAGIPDSTQVGLKFAAPGEREPEELVTPQKITPGDWRLEGGHLTSVGTWKVYVVMQRPDEYKKLVFEVPVVAPGTET